MGGGYWSNPLQFLVSTLFSLYILAVMLRLLLASSRADFYNPVSQFLVRITNPLVIPLRRVIPPIGRLDTATVVLLLALQA
ncbi:MAG: YggT family protein, partial [Gammaproteobacteria bacterium]